MRRRKKTNSENEIAEKITHTHTQTESEYKISVHDRCLDVRTYSTKNRNAITFCWITWEFDKNKVIQY